MPRRRELAAAFATTAGPGGRLQNRRESRSSEAAAKPLAKYIRGEEGEWELLCLLFSLLARFPRFSPLDVPASSRRKLDEIAKHRPRQFTKKLVSSVRDCTRDRLPARSSSETPSWPIRDIRRCDFAAWLFIRLTIHEDINDFASLEISRSPV